jgi:hypothetical protein
MTEPLCIVCSNLPFVALPEGSPIPATEHEFYLGNHEPNFESEETYGECHLYLLVRDLYRYWSAKDSLSRCEYHSTCGLNKASICTGPGKTIYLNLCSSSQD